MRGYVPDASVILKWVLGDEQEPDQGMAVGILIAWVKGEVDIAYVDKNQFWPVEVKWSGQLRPKQLKQITKYPNGLILSKSRQQGEIHGIPTIPLPLGLLRFGPTG